MAEYEKVIAKPVKDDGEWVDAVVKPDGTWTWYPRPSWRKGPGRVTIDREELRADPAVEKEVERYAKVFARKMSKSIDDMLVGVMFK